MLDWEFMRQYIPTYVQAAQLTAFIAVQGIVLSVIVGAICSFISYFQIPVLQRIAQIYIALSRNTPLLVQLFFLYFGLPKLGIVLSAESCAVAGLTFLGGSYMAEAFRSGLQTVEKSQKESAQSLGFSPFGTLRYIVFPQAMAVSVPALCANVIFLIKETSVVSAIALADLMYVANDLIGMYYKTDEALLLLVLSYFTLLLAISILATLLERRLRYAGFGN